MTSPGTVARAAASPPPFHQHKVMSASATTRQPPPTSSRRYAPFSRPPSRWRSPRTYCARFDQRRIVGRIAGEVIQIPPHRDMDTELRGDGERRVGAGCARSAPERRRGAGRARILHEAQDFAAEPEMLEDHQDASPTMIRRHGNIRGRSAAPEQAPISNGAATKARRISRDQQRRSTDAAHCDSRRCRPRSAARARQ